MRDLPGEELHVIPVGWNGPDWQIPYATYQGILKRYQGSVLADQGRNRRGSAIARLVPSKQAALRLPAKRNVKLVQHLEIERGRLMPCEDIALEIGREKGKT